VGGMTESTEFCGERGNEKRKIVWLFGKRGAFKTAKKGIRPYRGTGSFTTAYLPEAYALTGGKGGRKKKTSE